MRNLDVTTLRSFVAVADAGGVTRAAGFLHLTQSAVSMQLKRLEELLGVDLIDRSGRRVALTAAGEQLLVYARRIVALNDEVVTRLTDQDYEGEIRLGVPHDIVYPAIPQVLKQFNAAFPRVRVQLVSWNTVNLKTEFARGACDMILTTEADLEPGGETLSAKPLRWVGAPGGAVWRSSPLKLAFGRQCVFRPRVIEALDEADIAWEVIVETESDRTIEATVSADLAVHTMLDGTEPPHLERIDHGGALPELPWQLVNLYGGHQGRGVVHDALAGFLRRAFGGPGQPQARLKAV
ncbi:LysR family transcriptional regulator [Sulfitobacter sp. D35]|uniref:LysR family transcriptional regulator n=1 Tax=Sulfitobacter sp. D35 TaxID=3083252 RepID=UPI00296FE122|nr:LysR family transcriptional regulator [Sulfitobacter sp. D35]MDW4499598.1 LysR family transcriptional regulator [Sulfitobacter sp. D35]